MVSRKKYYSIDGYPLVYKVRSRFSDTDANRKISHIGLSRNFEDARIAIVKYAFEGSVVSDTDRKVFMARVAARVYRQPESYIDLDVGVGISRIGTSSYVYNVNVTQNGSCVAVSEAVAVAVDSANSVIPVHDYERPLLEKVSVNCSDILVDSSRPDSSRMTKGYYSHFVKYDTRFCETDLFSHINNVAVVTYYEDSLSEYIVNLIGDRRLYIDEIGRVAFSDVCFLSQIDYPGCISVASKLVEVASSSISINQAIFQGDQCVGVREVVFHTETDLSKKYGLGNQINTGR